MNWFADFALRSLYIDIADHAQQMSIGIIMVKSNEKEKPWDLEWT